MSCTVLGTTDTVWRRPAKRRIKDQDQALILLIRAGFKVCRARENIFCWAPVYTTWLKHVLQNSWVHERNSNRLRKKQSNGERKNAYLLVIVLSVIMLQSPGSTSPWVLLPSPGSWLTHNPSVRKSSALEVGRGYGHRPGGWAPFLQARPTQKSDLWGTGGGAAATKQGPWSLRLLGVPCQGKVVTL